MGPEKIAPVCAFLLSDAAKDVTGQIFAVRMNEIFLMSQSRPLRSVHRAEGWTPQTLAEHGIPALKSSFYKLDRSADVFNWMRFEAQLHLRVVSAFAGTTGIRPGAGLRPPKTPKNSA